MAGAWGGPGHESSELKNRKDAAFLKAVTEALLAANKEPWKKKIPLTQML